MLHTVRRRHRWLVVLVASGLVVLTPLVGGAQDADPEGDRQQVQERQASVGAAIDATRASQEEVSAALATVAEDVEDQQYRLADTERAVADAERSLADTRQEVVAARVAAERSSRQLQELAVDGYVRPAEVEQMDRLFTSEPERGVVRDALARSAVRSTADALDVLRAAREDLARVEANAAAAEYAARTAHADAETRLAELNLARARRASLVADVQTRLDHLLAEAAALSSRDAELAAQITQREAALAAQAAAVAEAAAAAQAAAPSARPISPGGSGVAAARSAGGVSVASVRGIEVSAVISGQLAAMLSAADADGLYLDGGGWRSPDEQIAIRMSVCGTSDYAIWEMPSWECSPPVARPGRSMHEQGLAIDFTSGDDLIRSSTDVAFGWLSANAARFGFYNLPSEPWHWSTTGQ